MQSTQSLFKALIDAEEEVERLHAKIEEARQKVARLKSTLVVRTPADGFKLIVHDGPCAYAIWRENKNHGDVLVKERLYEPDKDLSEQMEPVRIG